MPAAHRGARAFIHRGKPAEIAKAAKAGVAMIGAAPAGKVVRFQAAKSPGKLSDLLSGRPCDPRELRARFPGMWMAFLKAHFQSHMHAAVFFSVEEKTARLWWEGCNAPQGWAVDFAIQSIPSAKEWLRAA